MNLFTIRDAQLQAIAVAAIEPFLDRAEKHVRKHFPVQCAPLGRRHLRDQLRQAVLRAQEHGFTTERELARFAGLWVAFDGNFDRRKPWAAEILATRAPDRLERLIVAALDRPDEACGLLPPGSAE